MSIIDSQTAVFRQHVEGGGLPTPNDRRFLTFRIFRFGWCPSGMTKARKGIGYRKNRPRGLEGCVAALLGEVTLTPVG